MKKIYLILIVILFGFQSGLFAQGDGGISIGKGTADAHSSAILELVSSNKGLLIPRLTTAQRQTIASPAEGLLVYDTTLGSFYVYGKTAWNFVHSGEIVSATTAPDAKSNTLYYNTTEKQLYAYVSGAWTQVGTKDQALSLTGNTLSLIEKGNTTGSTVDLSAFMQNLELSGTIVKISGGNSIDLSSIAKKSLSLSGTVLTLQGDNSAVDFASLLAGKVDKTTTINGQPLSGNVTIAIPPVPTSVSQLSNDAGYITSGSLSGYESAANKITTIAAGVTNTQYPSALAVKTYADGLVSGGVADADAFGTKGKLTLAGDLGGTAALPTVPGLALKAPIASPSFTGTPLAPTAALGTNTTQIATTAFVLANAAGTTNLSYTPATGAVASSTGTGFTLPAATITNPGLLSATDKTKIDGLVTNATHTGDVTGSTVLSIAANAVTETKIIDGAVTGKKIAQMSATNGQVLSWDTGTTSWKPGSVSTTDEKVKVGAGTAQVLSTTDFDGTSDVIIKAGAITNGKLATDAVTTDKIATDAVTTDEIAVNAVTETEIKDAAVTGKKIAQMSATSGQVLSWDTGTASWKPGSVSTTDEKVKVGAGTAQVLSTTDFDGTSDVVIKTGAITTAKIADYSVTDTKLATNAVTTAKIADANVTIAKIANLGDAKILVGGATSNSAVALGGDVTMNNTGATTVTKIQGTVVSATAPSINGQVLSWNGMAWAPSVVSTTDEKVKVGTGTAQVLSTTDFDGTSDVIIKAGAITNGKLATDAVTADKIATDAVTETEIKDAAVTGKKIAQMSATNGQVLSWDTGTASWKPGSVSSTDEKVKVGTGTAQVLSTTDFDGTSDVVIKAGAITSGKLATDAVTTTIIADLNVTEEKLAADAVTETKVKDAAITGKKIAQMSAVNGQVLSWDSGTISWKPGTISTTDEKVKVGTSAAQVLSTTDFDGSGDITIKAGAITNGKLATDAVTTAIIANLNVTEGKLAADAVTETKVKDAAITGKKIAQMSAADGNFLMWDNTNSTWKPGSPSAASDKKVGVGTSDADPAHLNPADFANAGSASTGVAIKTGAVTSDKILNGTIATEDVADKTVTYSKMQDVTSAKLLGRNNTTAGAPEEITVGSGLALTGTTLTAINKNFTTVSSTTYTVSATDYIIMCMAPAPVGSLFTLPDPAISLGRTLIIIEGTGTSLVTFADAICVGATQSVGSGLTYLLVCDGTNWRICAQ